MIKEYIEREALLTTYRKWLPQLVSEEDAGDRRGVETCIAVLEEASAADVAEVKHGRWVICSDGYYPYCSECKNEPKHGEMTDYCPNCGAKMDGERREDEAD